MRFPKYIFLIFSSVLTEWVALADDHKVDSIYAHMTDVERVHQLVWLRHSSEVDLSHSVYDFGGVYFDQPLQEEPLFDGVAIAIQLDSRINPLPEQMKNLPDLLTLASITQSELLSTYFYFLKSSSKAYGIDYLVLPEIANPSEAQALLLDRMTAFDPSFFKTKANLSFKKTSHRKDIGKILASSDYWVVNTHDLEDTQKGLRKFVRKADPASYESKVKQALHAHTVPDDHFEIRRLPNQLAVAISKSSVIPLQKTSGILPLTTDTISLVTNQPYGPMANMLRKYTYVITAYEEIRKSNAPILIDDRSFVPPGMLADDRTIIYVGALEHLERYASKVDAALAYSSYSEIYDYVLPQQIFGTTDVIGRFPLPSPHFLAFNNDEIHGRDVLGYAPPEMTGLDRTARDKIDAIITEAIQSGSTPGCQLAIALDGAIIMNEAYGFLTYDSLLPVDRRTLYDLASVTKVTATLLAIMKLYEDGKIDLDMPIGEYIPEYTSSNKNSLTARAILAHHSGLKSYVPFWQKVLNSERLEVFYYETDEDRKTDKRSYGLRPDPILVDSLQNWILGSPLINEDKDPFYNYSDIGFMILHKLVEQVAQMPMDEYLEAEFYGKMGLDRLTFNPRKNGFELFEIAPTEYDYYFRNELVWGEVHDRNAAIFGGVAGHAGLFSNAFDLLVILQTMLQDGRYAGRQFLSRETINYFNHCYFPDNRRGLGWDKRGNDSSHISGFCSERSFGHTGFTGTMIWADPAYNLIFVFLSNRIYPNADNFQLNQKNIRTRIQDVVYEAILAKWMN